MNAIESFWVRVRHVYIFILMLFVISSIVSAQEWQDPNWHFRKQITIDHLYVAEDLSDFAVLIQIDDADLLLHAQASGNDIYFTDVVGKKLPHEIESYDSGQLAAWVRVNVSASSDTVILMYYGNENASNQDDPEEVWDSNYLMVQHLEEMSGTVLDSTAYGNDGMATMTEMSTVGKIGGAFHFDGIDDRIEVPQVFLSHETFTFEGWMNPNEKQGYAISQWINNQGAFIQYLDSAEKFQLYIGGSSVSSNAVSSGWHHVVATYDGYTGRLYVDGGEPASVSSAISWPNQALYIGDRSTFNRQYMGSLDEIRASDVARSDGYIKTAFTNQNDPGSFYLVGEQEAKNTKPIITDAVPDNGEMDVSIEPSFSFRIDDADGDSVEWSAAVLISDRDQWVLLGSGIEENGHGLITLSAPVTLGYNETYIWSVTASDPEGSGELNGFQKVFTTRRDENYLPIVIGIYPANNATEVEFNPALEGQIIDIDGDSVEWSVELLDNGVWKTIGSGTDDDGHVDFSVPSAMVSSYNTKYSWRVNARDLSGSGQSTTSMHEFWTKAYNHPPSIILPNYPDGASDVPLYPEISFTILDPEGGSVAWSIELFDGASWTIVDTGMTVGFLSHTSIPSVGGVSEYNKTYIWKVTATDFYGLGKTGTEEFSFRSRIADYIPTISSPSPYAGEKGVLLDPTVSASVDDLGGDLLDIDFYLKVGSEYQLVQSYTDRVSGVYSANIASLVSDKATTYYWKVVANDSNGNVAEEEFSFKTGGLLMEKWELTLSHAPYEQIIPVMGDVDGDGEQEIVLAANYQVMVIDGSSGIVEWTSPEASDRTVELADLDKDGIPEILHATSGLDGGPHVRALKGDGTILWTSPRVSGEGYSYFPILAYDIDGDGYPEVYLVTEDTTPTSFSGSMDDYTGRVTMLDHNGNVLRDTWAYHPCWGGLALADVNYDGVFELYLSDRNDNYNGGVPSRGLQAFNAHTLEDLWFHHEWLHSSPLPVISDVIGDDDLEVLGQQIIHKGVAVLDGITGDIYHDYTSYGLPTHAAGTVYDVDRDGNKEMIFAVSDSNNYPQDFAVFDLVDGVTDFQPTFDYWVTWPPEVGDVTGDGNLEILGAMGTQGTGWEDFPLIVYDKDFDVIDKVDFTNVGQLTPAKVFDVDGDGYNEVVVYGLAGKLLAFDTEAPTSDPAPRTWTQRYSELRQGAAEFVDYPGPKAPIIRDESPENRSDHTGTEPILSFRTHDFQKDPISYSIEIFDGSGWIEIGSGTDAETGTYSASTSGIATEPNSVYKWRVRTDDGAGHTDEKEFSFKTAANPETPVISNVNIEDGSFAPDSIAEVSFDVFDGQGDEMLVTVITSPDIGSFNGSSVSNGLVSVPVSGLVPYAEYSIDISVTDGKETSTESLTFETYDADNLIMDSKFDQSGSSADLKANGPGQDWFESREHIDDILTLTTYEVGQNPSKKAKFIFSKSSNAYLSQEFSAPQESTFSVRYDIYVDRIENTASSNDRAAIQMICSNTDGTSGPCSSDAERFVYMGFYHAGGSSEPGDTMSLVAREPGDSFSNSNSWNLIADDLVMDKWYKVRLDINVISGTYDVYIDGELRKSNVLAYGQGITGLSHASFAQWSDGAGTFYLDNVEAWESNRFSISITPVGEGNATLSPEILDYFLNSEVVVTASPSPGWTFSHWEGDIDQTNNPATVIVTGDLEINPVFTEDSYALTLDVDGNGTTAADPIMANYSYDDIVEVTATADPGSKFSHWSGDAGGNDNPLLISMMHDINVTAHFIGESVEQYNLIVSAIGDGQVVSDPNVWLAPEGMEVVLSALPDEGFEFVGWEGSLSGMANPATVTMDSDKSITARFQKVALLADTGFEDSINSSDLIMDSEGQDWWESRGDDQSLAVLYNGTVAQKSSKMLKMVGSTQGNAYITQEFARAQEGTFVVEWEQYIDEIIDNDPYADAAGIVIIGTDSGSVYGPNYGSANYFVFMDFFLDGGGDVGNMALRAQDRSGNPIALKDDMLLKRWHRMKVEIDVVSDTYDVYVDDELVADDFPSRRTKTELTHISFAQWNDGSGTFYVDNVYAKSIYSLSTSSLGNGSVITSPIKEPYYEGDEVILSAVPEQGFLFSEWSGDAAGSENPLTVIMDSDKGITAMFVEDPGSVCIDLDLDGYNASGEGCGIADCDDNNSAVNPSAPEACDGIDNDCDGLVDEGLLFASYADNDNDSYGDISSPVLDCSIPIGYVNDSSDCDDNNSAVNPSAPEACDGIDNNCDGLVDEGLLFASYADNDNDSYGGISSPVLDCSIPIGYVNDSSDCDDNNSAVNPSASEACDGIDNDCDGLVDEGLLFASYADNDNDSYGDISSPVLDCSIPIGYVNDSSDCDDNNSAVNPSASEVCFNGIDDNCNLAVDEGCGMICVDEDLDGYNASGEGCGIADCDDNNSAVNPSAPEACDGIDNDCDGLVDEDNVCSPHPFDGWGYRMPITIDSSQVEEDMPGFALLIDVNNQMIADNAQPDGGDILFASSGLAKIPHEIESYSDGHLIAWVAADLFAEADTNIYLYFGNANAENQENPEGVWDSGYLAVHHMDELFGALIDSTANDNDGSPTAGVVMDAAGMIEGGDSFNGFNSRIALPQVFAGETEFSFEGWMNAGDKQGYSISQWDGGLGAFIQYYGPEDNFQMYVGSASIKAPAVSGIWHHVAGTYDGYAASLYIDGEAAGSASIGPLSWPAQSMYLGDRSTFNRQYLGSLDEIRISGVARSQGHIATSYANQKDPLAFAKAGEVEPLFSVTCFDSDGDGYNVTGLTCGPVDCDDHDPAAYPGAAEECDGIDNDCDGKADEDGVCGGGPFSEWMYRKQIVIDSSNVDENLPGFAVLIDIDDDDLAEAAQADGGDILFASEGLEKVPHEIESYGDGRLVAWVRTDLSSEYDTIVYMYYGNSLAENQEDPEAVWDSNYLAVQHLEETAGIVYDSTSNSNDGAASSGVSMDSVGTIDGGDGFDGIGGRIALPQLFDSHDEFTFEGWMNAGDKQGYAISQWAGGSGAFMQYYGPEDNVQFYVGSTSLKVPAISGEWHHVVGTYDGSVASLFVDGGTPVSASIGLATWPAEMMYLGDRSTFNRQYLGRLDEIRISDVARSEAYVMTSYANQDGMQGFLDLGPEEDTSDNSSIVINNQMRYQKDTIYDPEDDGVEALIDGTIDMTVADTTFSEAVAEADVCTKWGIDNGENTTSYCNGGTYCCDVVVGVGSTDPDWDEPLYLTYGAYGADESNIVSSQVWYATPGVVQFSDVESLGAEFI